MSKLDRSSYARLTVGEKATIKYALIASETMDASEAAKAQEHIAEISKVVPGRRAGRAQ